MLSVESTSYPRRSVVYVWQWRCNSSNWFVINYSSLYCLFIDLVCANLDCRAVKLLINLYQRLLSYLYKHAAGSSTFTSTGSKNMADGPSRVPLHSLESMTDNFSEDRVLGCGAYGKVYLGERKDGQKIAVKILHDMPGHDDVQFDKEFYNLVNLQHQNIVQLVGYCHETRREYLPYNETKVLAEVTKRALCFEFMENGSLSDCLFDEFNGHGWRNRYAIIKGICNGLKYLHEELKPPIFHLDLKPANILLDKNMIPKIADFGLSRFFKEEKSHITNSPLGTHGYLPPEFINQNIISNKLDIFSLGVVIIKIMAGPEGHSRSAEMTSEKLLRTYMGIGGIGYNQRRQGICWSHILNK